MVLISKYSNCGNEVGNSMKSVMIFQIGPDSLVYGHFSMVLVAVSSNLPH